jgi:hypothetical protein
MLIPHPEEPRSGVSKDEGRASWFETREAALLTMRNKSRSPDEAKRNPGNHDVRPRMALRLSGLRAGSARCVEGEIAETARPLILRRCAFAASKDEGRASWFETAQERLLTMRIMAPRP